MLTAFSFHSSDKVALGWLEQSLFHTVDHGGHHSLFLGTLQVLVHGLGSFSGETSSTLQFDFCIGEGHVVHRETPVGFEGVHHLRIAVGEGLVGLIELERPCVIQHEDITDLVATLDGLVLLSNQITEEVVTLNCFVDENVRSGEINRASRLHEIEEVLNVGSCHDKTP